MTLDEAKEAKRACEKEIEAAIINFEVATGLPVSNVHMGGIDITNISSSHLREYLRRITLEVMIDP